MTFRISDPILQNLVVLFASGIINLDIAALTTFQIACYRHYLTLYFRSLRLSHLLGTWSSSLRPMETQRVQLHGTRED